MKGYLNKIEEWFVIYDQRTMQDPSAEDGMLPLHPNDVAVSSFSFYNGKEVEFEIMQYDGTIPILNAWNGYAKLIDKFDVEKEMFELEQQLDIPSHMRWHNRTSSQTETLYTEEQVIQFTMNMISQYVQGNTNIWNRELLKESLKKD